MSFDQLSHTLRDKLAAAFPSLLKLLDQDNQILRVIFFMRSLILEDSLSISDDQIAMRAQQVLLHLHVLVQAPRVQVFLHVLDDYCVAVGQGLGLRLHGYNG